MILRRLQELRLCVCVAGMVGLLGCAGGSSREGSAPAPTSVHEPEPPSPPPLIYVVRPGDSLGRIASCSGVSVAELARLNQISDPDLVLAGASLRLPHDRPCVVRRSPPARQAQPEGGSAAAATARARSLLATASARNDAADFEGALSLSETCVQELVPYRGDTSAKEVRARCHLVAGMAAAGLDRPERAIEEFRQAFGADPSLELSPETTSPRILELVSAAQKSP